MLDLHTWANLLSSSEENKLTNKQTQSLHVRYFVFTGHNLF